MPIHWYVNRVFINLCVSSGYREQWVGDGARKKSWCVEHQNLMPLATDIYSGNFFQFMKSEELMVGEDSKPEETCSALAGTHFTIGKIILHWKFWRVQIVQNWINRRIPRNSKWISQPSLQIRYSAENDLGPTNLANIQWKMAQAQQIRRMILAKRMTFRCSSSPRAASALE